MTANVRKIQRPLDRQGRVEVLRFLGGGEAVHCDSCGTQITPDNLYSWDEDGYAHCTAHGKLAKTITVETWEQTRLSRIKGWWYGLSA